MNETRRLKFSFSFFFILIIFISGRILLISADASENDGVTKKEENPSLMKIISGTFGKKFPLSSWELIRGAIQKIQMKLYPPNLDFRSKSKREEEGGGEEKVKEAATKSLEVSKEAIEETAKVAGGVVNEVVHKTTEKVTKQTSHDEL